MQHEVGLIESFIVSAKRDRWRSGLSKPGKRRKLTAELSHGGIIDRRLARAIPPSKQNVDDLEAILKEKGAPELVHLVAADSSLDGRQMSLREALQMVMGYGGAVISCLPGRLAYYEAEGKNNRWILEKTA